MSRATTSLNTADVTAALPHERDALAQIEKTFAHNRIILRALTERERIDLTRRLSGSLADASRENQSPIEPDRDHEVGTLRQALTDIAALSGGTGTVTSSAIAEHVLRIDPSSVALQQVAARLDSAGARGSSRRELLDRAATGLMQMLQARLPVAPRFGPSLDNFAGQHAARQNGSHP